MNKPLIYIGVLIVLVTSSLLLFYGLRLEGQATEAISEGVDKTVYVGGVAKISGGEVSYLHKNYLGSSVVETDALGNLVSETEYSPYGESDNSEGKDYTGKVKTGTGTVNLGAREYDAGIGRFSTPDNILSESKSTYVYANNNPYKYNDPDGNNPFLIVGLAALAGGIGNLAVDAWNGEIDSVGDGLLSFGQGAAAGFIGGAAFLALGPGAGTLATTGAIESYSLSTVRGDSPMETTANVAMGAAVGGALGRLTQLPPIEPLHYGIFYTEARERYAMFDVVSDFGHEYRVIFRSGGETKFFSITRTLGGDGDVLTPITRSEMPERAFEKVKSLYLYESDVTPSQRLRVQDRLTYELKEVQLKDKPDLPHVRDKGDHGELFFFDVEDYLKNLPPLDD